ncbi:prepilin-type N-terminal cleavage/methylation domain-containing protein [Candidatus Daviesbacteria bacterium]|nr:prepilin-type N-terminal cleavage/methylation domain-containing protein [Candidatus Daviesbacteria bacterium]
MRKTAQGFTLVELLVVIAIIAILAAVVVLIINPLELTRRGRDSARLADLHNLQQAINVAVQEASVSAYEILCVTDTDTSFPCTGKSTDTSSRATNGSGWVRVNLGTQKSVSVPTLPVDPTNSTTYHYTYCAASDAWEIDTVLESEQQKGRMSADGGNENATDTTGRYEVGSDLTLIAASGGSCTY